ncbi:hypothetical protein L5515_018165 [Caenorhabditis briggsae]|uniref:Uncharacterized protein n=1 Tax=Caenorhabditis briggsae TaxID=6238 RepID=A0AAE9JR72_CAEBR|nr:hypothetical protein L5515_018165 [Caenorhabditis briggsae]
MFSITKVHRVAMSTILTIAINKVLREVFEPLHVFLPTRLDLFVGSIIMAIILIAVLQMDREEDEGDFVQDI